MTKKLKLVPIEPDKNMELCNVDLRHNNQGYKNMEIVKKVDAFGNPIKIGDDVVFMRIKYRSLARGKVKSLSKKSVLIEYEENNLGKTESRQRFNQIFLIPKQTEGGGDE